MRVQTRARTAVRRAGLRVDVMEVDDEGTIEEVRACRAEIRDRLEFHGRVALKTA